MSCGLCKVSARKRSFHLAAQRLRQPGQWGSTTEILALTKLLGRPVTVHTEFGAPETYGADEAGAGLDIHFEANHYRAVTVSRKDEL